MTKSKKTTKKVEQVDAGPVDPTKPSLVGFHTTAAVNEWLKGLAKAERRSLSGMLDIYFTEAMEKGMTRLPGR